MNKTGINGVAKRLRHMSFGSLLRLRGGGAAIVAAGATLLVGAPIAFAGSGGSSNGGSGGVMAVSTQRAYQDSNRVI